MWYEMFLKNGHKISTGICGLLVSGSVMTALESETESKNSVKHSTLHRNRKILIDGYELKQVQILVRHGARTPIHTTQNVEEVGTPITKFVSYVNTQRFQFSNKSVCFKHISL